jgi:hypothetical protein
MVTDAAVGMQSGRDREMAIRQVDRFEGRYGLDVLDFACHAAFPLTLTTDVGYLLRQEYFPELGWSVAAELLLSNLCEVAGYDLYVIRVAVRGVLLERLVDRFGAGRVDDLARWMARYIQHRLAIEPLGRAKVLGYPSHWTALACLKGDDEVTRSIQAELSKLLEQTDDPSERFRLSALVESQGDLLAARGLQPLKLKELAARIKNEQSLVEEDAIGQMRSAMVAAGFPELEMTTVRTVFNVGSGEESYPRLKVQSYTKKDCAMDSLQNILTDALTTVGHFTNRNGPFSSHSSRAYL